MAVGEQDRGGVPVAPTVGFRRLDQPVDCTLSQVLTGAGRSDCYIYCSRSTLLDMRIFHDICHSLPDDCYDTTLFLHSSKNAAMHRDRMQDGGGWGRRGA